MLGVDPPAPPPYVQIIVENTKICTPSKTPNEFLIHTRSRKSIPIRAASRDDSVIPGIVFTLGNNITVVKDNNFLKVSDTFKEWRWPTMVDSQQPAKSIPINTRSSRPRSYSLTEGATIKETGNTNFASSESEADFSMSPGTIMAIPKRRSSIAATTNGPVAYTGSLAHLVPNEYLQTTSRRISTNGTAPCCICTSCSSTMTPYWRDGWSPHVMLCNACGLRYQKFARRCPDCLYIPRKEDSLGDLCVKCNTPWVIGSS